MERVGVVGCGLMGAGIAEVCARSGLQVVVVEQNSEALAAGGQRLLASLERGVKAGKLSEEERDAAWERLQFSDELGALSNSELVIEAIIERLEEKLELFAALDSVLSSPEAILASNTSSIPIIKLAMATSRPTQVIGLHFFNPVPVMGLVEVIVSMRTSDATTAIAESFVGDALDKAIIRAKDRAGFVVNALLIPYLLSAMRMLESSFASVEAIDLGMEKGCGHPMGPLRLCDFIGIDTVKLIADSLYAEFKDPQFVAPALLLRMVDGGLLGRKSGQGFYHYAR